MPLITQPVWRDTYHTTTATSVNYRIMLDGETIFSGRAVRYPDAEDLRININKVCSYYLNSDITTLLETLPVTETEENHPLSQRTFNLVVDGSAAGDYRFYDDWSYSFDKPLTGQTIIVSDPVNGHYFPGMLRLRTVRRSTASSSKVATTGNTSDNPGLGYDRRVSCVPYALYYLNAYGGWDALAIEGTVKRTDKITPYLMDRTYDNNTLEFEQDRYVQETKVNYALETGYLTDEESARLAFHIPGTVKAYLHNIREGWIKPVVINDTSVTWQTYAHNGRKLSRYTINVSESQSKLRRR